MLDRRDGYAVSSSSSWFSWSSPPSSWAARSCERVADWFPAVMCKNPYVHGLAAYGCGQCLPCRINRRRMWTHRIILESLLHGDNCFVTLTYDQEQLLYTEGYKCGLPTLSTEDLRNWLKRFRKEVEPIRIRYFAVGEYGDSGGRPHFHAAIFGWPGCVDSLRSRYHEAATCSVCGPVFRSWNRGHVLVGSLTLESAAYIAGYVVKKMTAAGDERLCGRVPEFARMSRMPGLGRDALWEVGDTYMKYDLEEDVSRLGHGGRKLPLGRYLTHQLRMICGKDEKAPEEVLDKQAKLLQPMREAAEVVASGAPSNVRREIFRAQFAENIVNESKGKVARLEAREEMFKKRGRL